MNDNATTPDTPHTTGTQPFNARSIQAALTANDLQKSLAWYRDVLGFAVDRQHERDGKLVAVSLKAGDVRILLAQDDGAKGMDRTKGEGISLQFTTDQDIDALANRVREQGGTFATEPTTAPWGARMFRVQDPDGFRLTFSSGNPG
jgi:uncharacterized glyoxalase superfamily protein PhnB